MRARANAYTEVRKHKTHNGTVRQHAMRLSQSLCLDLHTCCAARVRQCHLQSDASKQTVSCAHSAVSLVELTPLLTNDAVKQCSRTQIYEHAVKFVITEAVSCQNHVAWQFKTARVSNLSTPFSQQTRQIAW